MTINPIKPFRVLLLILLSPLIVPAYFAGILASIIWVSAYCGFKNNADYFMDGLGYETNEQILKRLVTNSPVLNPTSIKR